LTWFDLSHLIRSHSPYALVLVHGVGSRLEAWDGVASALAGRYRMLRYDLRGHGESEKPLGPYTLGDFVGDLAALVDELSIPRFHLAGFSLGGLVAQGFALEHGGRLERLGLLSTVAGRTEEERARVMARLDLVAGGIPGEHFGQSVDRWFTDEFRRANPDLIEAYAERNRLNDPQSYAAAYRVLATSDLAERLHEIRVPTLVVTGENDVGSNPRMARFIHERIRGSRLEILPRLRHSILIESPELIAELLGSFLASPDAQSKTSEGDHMDPRGVSKP
jgi:(E)-2-((N-methylformamido)methylene)succinate hydrolase